MESEEASPAESRRAYYVYGIVGAAEAAVPQGVVGLDGESPARTVVGGDLAAVVSEVPLGQFGEEALERNVRDVEWLEAKVRAHEAVLEAVGEVATVVPMRFGTIYAEEEHVREMLAAHGDAFRAALARAAGKREWGVKCFLERDALAQRVRATSEEARAIESDAAAKPEGQAYLLRRRLERLVAEEVDRIVRDRVREAHARLSASAEEARVNPLQRPAGGDVELVLNAAYLVELSSEERFRRTLAERAGEDRDLGLRYQLTGPWPPYNFVSIEGSS